MACVSGSIAVYLWRQFYHRNLVLASNLGWALSQNQIDERPGFADYVARMKQREAARRANELDMPWLLLPESDRLLTLDSMERLQCAPRSCHFHESLFILDSHWRDESGSFMLFGVEPLKL